MLESKTLVIRGIPASDSLALTFIAKASKTSVAEQVRQAIKHHIERSLNDPEVQGAIQKKAAILREFADWARRER